MSDHYDYVVVGGGMTGCGIVAELLDFRPDASILLVDKLDRLGGHWNFAYPYVRLHNFTSYYTLFGYPMKDEIRAQEKHRAHLPDILEYFAQIQQSFATQKKLTMRFGLTTSEVVELPGVDKGDRDAVKWSIHYADRTGDKSVVRAKTLVMCTHCRFGGAPPHKPIVGCSPDGAVPAKNIYPNQIEQMGDLKKVGATKTKIAVVGGGKTGADAVMHLYWVRVPRPMRSEPFFTLPRDPFRYSECMQCASAVGRAHGEHRVGQEVRPGLWAARLAAGGLRSA